MYKSYMLSKDLIEYGITHYIIEGYIKFLNERRDEYPTLQHTWIEIQGKIFDITLIQFNISDIRCKYNPEEYDPPDLFLR